MKGEEGKARRRDWRTLISGFGRDVDEICALLGCYAAPCSNCLPTFPDNVSVPSRPPDCPSQDRGSW
jgi:hypothetical protein